MRRLFPIFLLLVAGLVSYAQTPDAFKYQAILRDASGQIIINKQVNILMSIREGTPNGAVLFSEEHLITTNQVGLINLEIGRGSNQVGAMNAIDWGANTHFLRVDIDENGGTNFILLGASELLSVPYAFYAKDVENKQDLDLVGDTLRITGNNSATDIDLGPYLSNTDDQHIYLDNANLILERQTTNDTINLGPIITQVNTNTLDITNMKVQVLADSAAIANHLAADNDTSATNEIQDLSLSGDTLRITGNPGSTGIDMTQFKDSAQTLSLINLGDDRIIDISGGNSITVNVADQDADTTNEIQTLNLTGSQILQIIDANGVITNTVDLSPFMDNTDSQDLIALPTAGGDSVQLGITGGVNTFKLAIPSNMYNSSFTLNGDTLEITDSAGTLGVDLSQYNNLQDISDTSLALRARIKAAEDSIDAVASDLASHVASDLDTDVSNEIITNMVLSNDSLKITEAGNLTTVDLSPLITSNDADSTNELNTSVTFSNDSIIVSDGGGSLGADLSSLEESQAIIDSAGALNTRMMGLDSIILDSVAQVAANLSSHEALDNDRDSTNEALTSASMVGDSLLIVEDVDSFYVDMSQFSGTTNDNDSTNELNTGIAFVNDSIQITDNGGTLGADLSSLEESQAIIDSAGALNTRMVDLDSVVIDSVTQVATNLATHEAADLDLSATNELNSTLTFSNDSIRITDSGGTLGADLSSLEESQAIIDSSMALDTRMRDLDSIIVDSVTTVASSFATHLANDNDLDSTNELISSMAIVNDSLRVIESGDTSFVDLAQFANVPNNDNDSTNELNTGVAFTNDSIQITDAGGTIGADLSSLEESQAIIDSSMALDTRMRDLDSLIIDSVTTVASSFATHLANDNDLDSTNELNTGIAFTNDSIQITDPGGTIGADLSSLEESQAIIDSSMALDTRMRDLDSVIVDSVTTVAASFATHLATDNDLDSTNELITDMSMVNDSLRIIENSDTAFVDLGQFANVPNNDNDSTNELNTGIAFVNDSIQITDNGGTLGADLSSLEESQAIIDSAGALNTRMVDLDSVVTDSITQVASDLAAHESADNDLDSTNEALVSATMVGDSLRIVEDVDTFFVDMTQFANLPNLDNDSTNEQNVSVTFMNDSLFIQDNGGTLNADLTSLEENQDISDTAAALRTEMADLDSVVTDSITVVAGDLASHITADNDTSSTNELVDSLTYIGNELKIYEGGQVRDSVTISGGLIPALDTVLATGKDAGGDSILNVGVIGVGTNTPSATIDVQNGNENFSINVVNAKSSTTDLKGVFASLTGTNSGDKYGIYGEALNGSGTNYGVYGEGRKLGSGTAYGVYGTASGGTTNYAGYFDAGDVYIDNNLGIGATSTTRNLLVSGAAEMDSLWSDSLYATLAQFDSLRIANQFSFPTTDGTNGQYLETDGSGNLSWVSPSSPSFIEDGDGDTYIETEDSPDEDYIRMFIRNREYLTIDTMGRMGINMNNPAARLCLWDTLTSSGNLIGVNAQLYSSGAGAGDTIFSYTAWAGGDADVKIGVWSKAYGGGPSGKYYGFYGIADGGERTIGSAVWALDGDTNIAFQGVSDGSGSGGAVGVGAVLVTQGSDDIWGLDVTTSGDGGIGNSATGAEIYADNEQGTYGVVITADASGIANSEAYGVDALAQDAEVTYGGYFEAIGSGSGSDTAYGIYAEASGSSLDIAAYFGSGKVVVSDTLVLQSGAANGSILTSDANGVATWQAPSNAAIWDTSATTAYLPSLKNVAVGTDTALSSIHVRWTAGFDNAINQGDTFALVTQNLYFDTLTDSTTYMTDGPGEMFLLGQGSAQVHLLDAQPAGTTWNNSTNVINTLRFDSIGLGINDNSPDAALSIVPKDSNAIYLGPAENGKPPYILWEDGAGSAGVLIGTADSILNGYTLILPDTAPDDGQYMSFNSTSGELEWTSSASSSDTAWVNLGDSVLYNDGMRVGINDSFPPHDLFVVSYDKLDGVVFDNRTDTSGLTNGANVFNTGMGSGDKTGLYAEASGTGGIQNVGIVSIALSADTAQIGVFASGIGSNDGPGSEATGVYGVGQDARTNYGLYGDALGDSTTTARGYGVYTEVYGHELSYGAALQATGGATGSGSDEAYGVLAEGVNAETNYGIYASAYGGTNNYAGYFDSGLVYIQDTLILNLAADSGAILRSVSSSGHAVWVSDTLVCPSGFTKVNETFCIETAERTTATWFVADSTCAASGYELPGYGDWYSGAAIATLTDETDDNEWVRDISQNNMMIVGSGGIRNRAFQDPTLTAPYRCIYRKP